MLSTSGIMCVATNCTSIVSCASRIFHMEVGRISSGKYNWHNRDYCQFKYIVDTFVCYHCSKNCTALNYAQVAQVAAEHFTGSKRLGIALGYKLFCRGTDCILHANLFTGWWSMYS